MKKLLNIIAAVGMGGLSLMWFVQGADLGGHVAGALCAAFVFGLMQPRQE